MKYGFKYLIFTLAAAAASMFASCSQTEEIMDNIPYGRVLSPLDFTAEVVKTSGTDVVFKWQVMQNAEAFELQVFEAVEGLTGAGYDEVAPLKTVTVAPDEVPYTISGFEVDKDFYARVRGTSTKVEDSNWSYLEKEFSTYPVRSDLNPVVVKRTETAIEIAWDDAADKSDLTAVRVATVSAGGEDKRIELTAEQKNACTMTVDGLEPATEYKLTLIFGKAGERGAVTAWTRPQTGKAMKVSSVAEFVAAIDGATSTVELLVAYSDASYDFATNEGNAKTYSVKAPLTIYGETSEEGKKPVLANIAFSVEPGATAIRLEDLSLDGGKSGGATITMAAGDYTAVEVVNCEIYGYTKGLYSVGGSVAANVDKLLFKGVFAHDINANGKEGGDFIDVRCGLHKDIEVTNSTFYACARTFLRMSDSAKSGNVAVRNCTFNYAAVCNVKDNAGIFAIRVVTEPQSIVCEKNVFMNEYGEDNAEYLPRLVRNSTDSYAPVCNGNFYYNMGTEWWVSKATLIEDGTTFSEEIGMKNGKVLSADPCVNSEAGKLYLVDGAIAEAGVGDPRWWNASEPKVERATSLVTVTEPTVWDFTDKTKFDSETIETNTIIENIRIYAPAEVVMSKGVSFASGASVNEAGVPTACALGFRAEGVGSVKVTTADGGFNASVHVLVGSDRYTVPADGKEHTVPFGDIHGENDIYVLAGSAVTITKVEWSSDLTPDEAKSALAAPKVALSPSSFEVGNEENITVNVTWTAVENAADYVVAFNGVETTVAGTTYTISAAEAASLAVGDYTVSVVARPVATSSKYSVSAAGEASFTVKAKPVVGGTTVWTWDFASAAWQAELADKAASAKGTNQDGWTVSVDGFTYTSGSKNGKWDSDSDGTFIQPNGGGDAANRVFSFTAPAAGTLKVTAKSASTGSERNVTVSNAGTEKSKGVDALAELEFEVEAGEVYIYPSGGIRFYKFEFTYSSGGAVEPTVWNLSSNSWQTELANKAASAENTNQTDWTVSVDGLTYTSGSGNGKWGSDSDGCYIQPNGGGDTTKRVFSFVAATGGTVKVTAKSASTGTERNVTVSNAGAEKSKGVDALAELEFEVEAGVVYIYPAGGIRFYSIEFDGGVAK